MTLRILNDLHIGAIRSAGTTPETQLALRKRLLDKFSELLPVDQDLMLLGDLFDTNNVALSDVLQTLMHLHKWLTDNPRRKLFNVYGNHDASKTSTVLSSFQFLGKLLSKLFPDRYVHIEKPTMTEYGYVVPHMLNQVQFDHALTEVPTTPYLFVHCNYDNHFAAQSDQSLNISAEQAKDCKAKMIVFAHEHHARDIGKVRIPGNQMASSVSDWLPRTNKRYLTICDDGTANYTDCAVRADEFAEIDVNELETYNGKALFIRVSGSATSEESAGVVTKLNKFRKRSEALVITNAVAVETADGIVTDFESTLDAAKNFSVMDALKPHFTADEYTFLESLCS
jgi:hypothetical protein